MGRMETGIKYFLLSFLLSVVSCVSGTKDSNGKVEAETTLVYDQSNELTLKYSDLFSGVELIPLDTTGDFLVTRIRQMKFALDHFFIQDEDKQLFVFDRQGKGCCIINKQGSGAEEYLSIRGFDVQEVDSTICLFTYPKRMMRFSLDGKLLDVSDMEVDGFDLLFLKDRSWAIFTDNVNEDPQLLAVSDLSTGKTSRYIPGYRSFAGRKLPVYQQARFFSRLPNGEVLFFHPLSNLIYTVSSDGVSVKYLIDFGKNNPPVEYPEDMPPMSQVDDFVEKNQRVYGFNSCWENDKFFYIQTKVDDKLVDILWDKEKQILYSGYFKDDLTECQVFLSGVTDSYLAGYITVDVVMELVDYLKSRSTKDAELTLQKLGKLADYTENEGNPIVCLYHFK